MEIDPLPTTKVAKNTTVNLVISSGKTSEKTITVNVKIDPAINKDIQLKAYLDGEKVEDKTVNPAHNAYYSLTFTGSSGQKNLTIELDGSTYQEYILDFDEGIPKLQNQYPFNPPVESEPEPSQPSSSTPDSSDAPEGNE